MKFYEDVSEWKWHEIISIKFFEFQMVMLLMQHGADPNIKDGEGCSGLHLAAQFGHTAIVAYLVAKRFEKKISRILWQIFWRFFSNFSCHINDTDGNGMTAVMWSCFRATQGLDPTRLLLTLGKAVFHLRGLLRLKPCSNLVLFSRYSLSLTLSTARVF